MSAEARIFTIIDQAHIEMLEAVCDRDMAKLFTTRDRLDKVFRAWANYVKGDELLNEELGITAMPHSGKNP